MMGFGNAMLNQIHDDDDCQAMIVGGGKKRKAKGSARLDQEKARTRRENYLKELPLRYSHNELKFDVDPNQTKSARAARVHGNKYKDLES